MNPAQRNQLKHLDRCIASLLDERARLLQGSAGESRPAVDDLMRRSSGSFPADLLREVFELIDRGSGKRDAS